MDTIEKLIYLISEYNKSNYTTSDFCDLFECYYRDSDLPELSDFAEKWLQRLDELCGRFSEFPEDLAIPNAFIDAQTIKAYTKSFTPKMFENWCAFG